MMRARGIVIVISAWLASACSAKRGGRDVAGEPRGREAGAAVDVPCAADPSPCPGVCNAQGYCEQDLGWGTEIRLPAALYVVDYRGRMHSMTEPSLYEFSSPFWIDKYELSGKIATKCEACRSGAASDDMPAQVTREAAVAICAAAGKRLPTNAEWESAARGPSVCTDPNRLKFEDAECNTRGVPWGVFRGDAAFERFVSTFCDHALIADCGAPAGPRPVADRPAGASPLGVQDMIGNVSEWIVDMDGDEGLVKGGDWTTPGDEGMYSYVSIGARAREKVDRKFGVRCVRGPVMDVKPRLRKSAFGAP